MKIRWLTAGVLALMACALPAWGAGPIFAISFPASKSAAPLDGRLILLLTKVGSSEPRDQFDDDDLLKSPYIFGRNVDALKPGEAAIMDFSTFGWPAQSLSAVKPGDYFVQAVLNRYETFHRADGSVVKLPPDKGEGQQWNSKPGNLYSTPVKIHFDPARADRTVLVLDQEMPPITPKTDSEFVKHVMIKSDLLSKFWGRPMYIGAHVLLPWGFTTHPNAHYPLMVFHGHFPDDISEFRTTPPDQNLKLAYSDRFHIEGYNQIVQREEYGFYKKWISPHFPRYIVIEIEHANPYYDDSYAVNSANLGPYGDAINKELIPYIEQKFRGIGQGWARFTYGGSTGGWEALATQVFYPDMYNGTFAACPDPIDFHAYGVVNLYADKNAYTLEGEAHSIQRPSQRNYLGEVFSTVADDNHAEAALGDRSRSGGQYDIWQAVFGPQGADGYPQPIWDKLTGDIDHNVVNYWRDHFDLTHIIQRDWATLGPKLAGKIHIYVGSADTYYLNDAVYYAQDTLEALKNPAYGGLIDYGDRAEHCWNGDHTLPNGISRLHYNTFYLPLIMARIKATAPKGADLTSWRY